MGKWLEKRKQQERTKLATATLTPSSLHIYQVPADGYNRTQKFIENQKHLRQNKHKGELSDKAVKRIKQAIEWLLIRSTPKPIWNRQQQKVFFFRLNFITLTLPSKQIHSDQEIKSVCLNNFLNLLRKNPKFNDYLWKAEAQGNGNIHFHITTNCYFSYQDIAKYWESSLNLLGYIDRFEEKFHHRHPPCSQIQKVKHVRKLAAYLSKYMAKNKSFSPVGELRKIKGKLIEVRYTDKVYRDEKAYGKTGVVVGTMLSEKLRPIEANLWGCSQSISQVKALRFDIESVQWDSIRKLSFSGKVKRIPGDYVDSYYGEMYKIAREICPGLYEDMKAHANFSDIDKRYTAAKELQYLE